MRVFRLRDSPAFVRSVDFGIATAHDRTEIAVNARHSMTVLVVLAGTALPFAGCGGDDDSSDSSASANSSGSSSQSTQPASTGSSSAVKIDNFKFSPASVTVKQGAGLSISNQDSTAHTATANDGHSFDT